MPNAFEDDSREYLALCNEEEQYSLWPHGNEVPEGWRVVYGPESREKVIDHIDRVWTDMRPKSLRQAQAEHEDVPA
jgi:MbtH protein